MRLLLLSLIAIFFDDGFAIQCPDIKVEVTAMSLKQHIRALGFQERFTRDQKHQAIDTIVQALNFFNQGLRDVHESRYHIELGNDISVDGSNVIGYLYPLNDPHIHIKPIYIVMAHYDTVPNTSGVTDNAAGVAVMIQLAHTLIASLRAKRTKLDYNIWFVATDTEELMEFGSSRRAMGSHQFLQNLDPGVRQRIQGAYILDSLGSWSVEVGSQKLPPFFTFMFPKTAWKMKRHGSRGNFIASIADSTSKKMNHHFSSMAKQCSFAQDLPLVASTDKNAFHLLELNANGVSGKAVCALTAEPDSYTPPEGRLATKKAQVLQELCRSDHLWFWDMDIPALHISDTAEFRNPCYHRSCDTLDRFETEGSLEALAKLTLSLASALLNNMKH